MAKAKAKAKAAPKLKPRPKQPPLDPSLLRGVALVDAVMAERRETEELTGLPARTLDAMRLGELPLTPALRRWLETDSEMFTLGPAQPLRDLVEAELGEWVAAFEPLYRMLTAPCVLFEDWGSDSRRLIYLGTPDEHGEYPVFTLDIDDTPYACINGPVDVWLAQQAGYLSSESVYGKVPVAYEATRRQHAKLNFGGNIAFAYDRFSDRLDP